MADRYCVDTSALIDGLERYYPANQFGGLWEAVDELIDDERFFFSEEVWEEIKKKDEVVKAWATPRKDRLAVATDPVIATEVQAILTRFKRLVMSGGRRNRADPFVIAVAKLRHATVVTGEVMDSGNDRRPKIPFVCRELQIPCIRFTELIGAEGWTFQRS